MAANIQAYLFYMIDLREVLYYQQCCQWPYSAHFMGFKLANSTHLLYQYKKTKQFYKYYELIVKLIKCNILFFLQVSMVFNEIQLRELINFKLLWFLMKYSKVIEISV
mgnify:CR=1 FL=1